MIYLLLVFLPIAAALAAYPIARRSERAGSAFVISIAALVLALTLSLAGAPETLTLPGLCGLGLSFCRGNLRTVLAIAAAVMWLCTALASPEYFHHAERRARYYMFYLWTLGALMGVFLAGDLLTLFVFFEIMSFTSYVWVAQNETPEALRASETYLFIAVIGGLTMLVGLFLLYSGVGTLTLGGIAAGAESLSPGRRLAIGICLLVGFGAKAGMFPLHIWLPKAHPVAPAPASALLSGILTKSGVFGVIAVTCYLFEGVETWGRLLLVPAVITMTLGALLAVFSTDLKRTLACSSMSQIGFILTGVAMLNLLGHHGAIAAWGAALHIVNHSLIKLTLFIAAGVVYLNTHSLDLNDIRGFGRGKPLLMLAFLSGACSIAGIPGFGGYISKTLLHESIVEYAHLLHETGAAAWPYTLVEWLFLISGGLTFAYMARLFYIIFLAPKAEGQHEKPGKYMGAPTAAVLALCGVAMPALGLSAHLSMDKIAVYAAGFMGMEHSALEISYFSFGNLKGAAISISIGVAVLLLVGFGVLTKRGGGQETYKNVWPARLDLENSVYRPALRALSVLGAIAARAVETAGAVLVYGAADLIFLGAKKTVEPGRDAEFAVYNHPKKRGDVERSFSGDLLAAVLGVVIILAFVLAAL
ncbi:MAG: sodium:proton antiporter [Butyricicoccus sp.]|nr:sodium:proton antiporter [Butyricicoccus sp.]